MKKTISAMAVLLLLEILVLGCSTGGGTTLPDVKGGPGTGGTTDGTTGGTTDGMPGGTTDGTTGGTGGGTAQPVDGSGVIINGRNLSIEEMRSVWQMTNGTPDFPEQIRGNWWYDTTSGLYGQAGQSITWILPAGLDSLPVLGDETKTALRTMDPGASLPEGEAGMNYSINGRTISQAEDLFWRWLSYGTDAQNRVLTQSIPAGAYQLDSLGNISLNGAFVGNVVPLYNLRVYGDTNGPSLGRSRIVDTNWLLGNTVTESNGCFVVTVPVTNPAPGFSNRVTGGNC